MPDAISSDNEVAFERWAGEVLGRIGPAGQAQLKRDLAAAIRLDQIERIKGQLNPDGTPYEPRKARKPVGRIRSRKGKIKQGIMFKKLAASRFMKYQNTPEGLAVGFFGRVARLARIHQEGLQDEVTPGGPSHRYAQRVLLGLTPSTRKVITSVLLNHISK